MTYLTLYRKWRPQCFEDVVGQDHVVRTLTRALREGRMAHAYLFAGPRGTGKTTMARLLAKGLNCEQGVTPQPCNRCESCVGITDGSALDVVEIDGASNRGIDEVRELRDRVRYAPARARRKVYIIDEVHMLTHEAFNALLKVLEEPPGHVTFVFATTEPHRVPATVMSRCQRFDFRRLGTAELTRHLKRVAQAEGMAAQEEALELIARHADGGVRDALAMLEQCAVYGEGPITAPAVAQVLGLVPADALARLADAYARGQVEQGLLLLKQLMEEQGLDGRVLLRDLVGFLRSAAVARMLGPAALSRGEGGDPEPDTLAQRAAELAEQVPLERMVAALDALLSAEPLMRWAPDPRIVLEVQLMRLGSMAQQAPASAPVAPPAPAATAARAPASTPVSPSGLAAAPAPSTAPGPAAAPGGRAAKSAARRAEGGEVAFEEVVARWPEVLATLKSQQRRAAARVEALLREGRPVRLEGLEVVVGFPADREFHRTAIEDPASRSLVEKVLARLFGRPMSVRTERLDGENAAVLPPPSAGPVSLPAGPAQAALASAPVQTVPAPSPLPTIPPPAPAQAIPASTPDDDFDPATLKAVLDILGGRLIKELDPEAAFPDAWDTAAQTADSEGEGTNGRSVSRAP